VSRSLVPVLILAAVAPPLGSAPKPKEEPKPPPVTLVGTWAVESSTLNGVPLPSGDLVVTFNADGTSENRSGGKVSPRKYTHDPKKDPAELDSSEREPLALPWRGIYRIDGDTLTICVSTHADVRPTSFEAGAGSNVIRTVYKRVKAKD
jgi:uncharacterized protein (TIGR03067 family)